MIYVFPHFKKLEVQINELCGINRLFAYPIEPITNNSKLVILNNAAYSQKGKELPLSYMKNLSEHYEKYSKENVLCVAPDSYMNPMQTMLNFKKWKRNGLYKNIAAVLQSENKVKISLDNLKRQVDFYREYTDTIFVGNNGMYGKDAKEQKIERLFRYMKQQNVKWIHCLGAGWNMEDIKYWKSFSDLDSIDSVAFYSTKNIKDFGTLDRIEIIKKINNFITN